MIFRKVEMTDHQWMTVHQAANSFCVSAAAAAGLRAACRAGNQWIISLWDVNEISRKFSQYLEQCLDCLDNTYLLPYSPQSAVNDWRQASQFRWIITYKCPFRKVLWKLPRNLVDAFNLSVFHREHRFPPHSKFQFHFQLYFLASGCFKPLLSRGWQGETCLKVGIAFRINFCCSTLTRLIMQWGAHRTLHLLTDCHPAQRSSTRESLCSGIHIMVSIASPYHQPSLCPCARLS